jgi:hypothetical protein
MSDARLSVKPDDPTQLAERINDEHRRCVEAACSTLEHARKAGELLLEAKAQLPHGGWLPWLREHFTFSDRVARNYMRVAREWDRIAEANRNHGSDLTYRQGLRLLSAPDNDGPFGPEQQAQPGRRSILDSPQEWREFCAERWWDLFAMFAVLLDARGWEPQAIAKFWGRQPSEVEAVLRPQPPRRFHSEDEGQGWFPAPAHYVADVERSLACWQWAAYSDAAHAAAEAGWDELVPQLKAMARHHEHRWKVLHDRDLSAVDLSEEDTVIAGCCATTDARIAAGIEVCGMTLREMWDRFAALPGAKAS